MTKQISILALTAIFLAACTSPSTVKDKVEQKVVEKVDKVKTTKQSLKDLLGLGVAQKCTYNFSTGDTNSEGEIIVSGKKFRQTTKIMGDNGNMTVSAYSDGEYMYTWNDQVPNSGIKFKIEDTENDSSPSTGKESAGTESVDMNQQYDYNCTPTTVTDADWKLPAGMQFTDMAELSKFGGMDLEKLKKQFGDDN